MKPYIKFLLITPAVIALTSCEDKTEYVPVEPDAADCMGVYFDANNDVNFIFVPGEDAVATLSMHRERTDQAAEVPLLVTCDNQAVVFPQSVTFAEGSADADLVIDFASLPEKLLVNFEINIPDQYINHYAKTHFNYASTALISQWTPANVDGSPVKFYFSENDYVGYYDTPITSAVYQPVESLMDVLPGAALYRITNFLNTGVDITFSSMPCEVTDYAGYYRFSPVTNFYTMRDAFDSDDYGEDYYNAWYLVDKKGHYMTANLTTLGGVSSTLQYVSFYWYSNTYDVEYSYGELKDGANCISIGISGVPESSVSLPDYFYLNFRWDGPSGL